MSHFSLGIISENHHDVVGFVLSSMFFNRSLAMRYFVGAIVLSLLLGSASSAVAQDKEKSKSGSSSGSKDSKVRGVLPQHYRQLGLSDEQRQAIYKIQNEYSDKIDDMQKKIDDIKAERNAKYLKSLTKAQRDRLEEIKKGAEKDEKAAKDDKDKKDK
jgi:TolA-binding protein